MTAWQAVTTMCLVHQSQTCFKKKNACMHSWLARREEESVYHTLLRELRLEDHETMRNWIRLDKNQ